MEKYLAMLRQNGIKVTPQRLGILKYLDTRHSHPTAEMIYRDLKTRNPTLSKTTVYNTLDTLKEHGLIRVLTISENELRYDIIIKQHHHFICRKCGNIEDIDIECPHFSTRIEGGMKVEEVHGYFKGVCDDCQGMDD